MLEGFEDVCLSFLSRVYLWPETGTLPTEIGLLQGLDIFLVNDNAFDGNIPSEVGLLSSAELIQLDLNKFSTSGVLLVISFFCAFLLTR